MCFHLLPRAGSLSQFPAHEGLFHETGNRHFLECEKLTVWLDKALEWLVDTAPWESCRSAGSVE